MRDISALHPELQQKIAELQKLCEKNNLKIGISECLRTVAEQDALYAQGRTKPGSIVTNAKGSTYSSQHQWGIAFDFYRNDGTGTYNESGSFFDQVGSQAKSVGLGWGGDWQSPVDKPHLYLPQWGSTTTLLKQQYGTPGKFMQTWAEPASGTSAGAAASSAYTRAQFIKDVQTATGAKADGIAGSETIFKTVTVSAAINRKHAVVKAIQQYLYVLGYTSVGEADGIAGAKFTTAVKEYQRKALKYTNLDGEITAKQKMWKSLLGLV